MNKGALFLGTFKACQEIVSQTPLAPKLEPILVFMCVIYRFRQP